MWTSVLATLTTVMSTQCVQIPKDLIPVRAKLNIQEMVQHAYYLYLVRTYSILKDEFIEKYNYYWNNTIILSLRNRTTGRRGRQAVRVWQTWQGYYLRVFSWSSLNLNAFWSFRKRSYQRKVKFREKSFETKLLSGLSCHARLPPPTPLPSPVLLRKFTNMNMGTVIYAENIPRGNG